MKGSGTTPGHNDAVALYEQLLELAGKEQRAVMGGNLEELEACLLRKEEIVQRLGEIGSKSVGGTDTPGQPGVGPLIEQVLQANVGVARSITRMLEDCRRTIVAVRAGKRAELAYQESRRRKRERSPKVL